MSTMGLGLGWFFSPLRENKVTELQLRALPKASTAEKGGYFGLTSFKIDGFDLFPVQSTLKSLL